MTINYAIDVPSSKEPNKQKPQDNIISVTSASDDVKMAAYTVASLGMCAAAIRFGDWYTLSVGAALAGGLAPIMRSRASEFIEDNLRQHPNTHDFSPNLGQMVDELYTKTGLGYDDNPVYDFRPKRLQRDAGPIAKLMHKMLRKMANTPNAAAAFHNKPIIMISEPLLEALDDAEEYAVLAHEFGHAQARHSKKSEIQSLVTGAASISNSLVSIVEWVGSGVTAVVGSVASAAGVDKFFRAAHTHRELYQKEDADLNPAEQKIKERMERPKNILTQAATLGITALFNPLYPAIYATAKGLNLTGSFLSKARSRTNEYHADRAAVELGADPLAMVTALRKITVLHQEKLEEAWGGKLPKPGLLSRANTYLFSTHPNTDNRISALAKIAFAGGATEQEIDIAVNGAIELDDIRSKVHSSQIIYTADRLINRAI